MKTSYRSLVVLIASMSVLSIAPARAADAEKAAGDPKDILAAMRKALAPGEDLRAKMKFVMRHEDTAVGPVEWTADVYRRYGEAPVHRIVLRSPKDLAGIETLVIDRSGGMDAIRMYFPSLRRARTIRKEHLGAPFLGTDFNYEHLGLEEIDFQRHELAGEGVVMGRPCHEIVSVPDESLFTWYGKIVRCIDKENHLPLRTEYFDESEVLFKVRTIDEVKAIEGFPTPVRITMTTEPEHSSTTLIFSDVDYDVKMKDTVLYGERRLDQAAKAAKKAATNSKSGGAGE